MILNRDFLNFLSQLFNLSSQFLENLFGRSKLNMIEGINKFYFFFVGQRINYRIYEK